MRNVCSFSNRQEKVKPEKLTEKQSSCLQICLKEKDEECLSFKSWWGLKVQASPLKSTPPKETISRDT